VEQHADAWFAGQLRFRLQYAEVNASERPTAVRIDTRLCDKARSGGAALNDGVETLFDRGPAAAGDDSK
jgi:hypothetical protein